MEMIRGRGVAFGFFATSVALEGCRLLTLGLLLLIWTIGFLLENNPWSIVCIVLTAFLVWNLLTLYRSPWRRPPSIVRIFLITGHALLLVLGALFLFDPADDLAFATILAGVPSITSIIAFAWMPRILIPQGHCPNCEYPLTGLREPRCPECGTKILP